MKLGNFRYTNSFYPFNLSWMITTNCNIDCSFCFLSCMLKKRKYDGEEVAIDNVLSWCKRHKIFTLEVLGGEPFLEKNKLIEIIDKTRGGFPCLTRISTNGTIYDEKIIEALTKNFYFKQLQISLDTASPKTYFDLKGKDYYSVVIDNIRKFNKKKVPISVSVVLSTRNYNEIDKIIEIIHDLKVKNISFDGVMSCYSNLKFHKNHLKYREMVHIKNMLSKIEVQDVNVILNSSHSIKGNCSAGFTEMAMLPNGDLYPCSVCVSNNALKIGNIKYGINKNYSFELERFLNLRINNKCQECKLPSICDGACKLVQIENSNKFFKDIVKCDEIIS